MDMDILFIFLTSVLILTQVSLQEVWSIHDYEYIKEKTALVLPFTHYFHR